jgi:hypothetical protein
MPSYDALNVAELGFDGVEPAATGRPSNHPPSLLKLYIYGYLKPQLANAIATQQLVQYCA